LFILEQCGQTTFDLRDILQKRDNLWATSKKMMYETTDLQHLKLKKGRTACHWNYYTIADSNLLQITTSGKPVVKASLTLVFLHQYQC